MLSGGNTVPDVVYALQGNGIDRAETAGCNGKGWRENECYTLNTIDRPAVVYDARGNGDGETVPTLTGDHQNSVTDYTAICISRNKGKLYRKYIARRLTPLECCRLQGFPDGWGDLPMVEMFSDDEAEFWEGVRSTHAQIMGKKYVKAKNTAALVNWYNKLDTDSAEYKMWGNGIALPCARFVLEGVAQKLIEMGVV